MLQDFSFKILHKPGLKHGNVDALSRNPVGQATDDDDFRKEILDVGTVQTNAIESARTVFSTLYGKTSDWLGFRRHANSEESQNSGPLSDNQALKKERVRYYDRQQQLELALAAQVLLEFSVLKFSSIESNDKEDREMGTRCNDI
ncbi:unnamed protein product [Sphagnum tenellum]